MKKFLILVLPLIFFVSCASAPKQTNYGPMLQKHMQAARHWNLLAQSFSNKVSEVLKNRQATQIAESVFGNGAVYLDKRDKSVFGKAFRTMLITELSKHDIEVADNPEGAYLISWGCQKIYHENDRCSIFPGIPMLIVETVKYLLVGGDFNPKKPHCEVMITLNLYAKENQLLRQTGIKYVNNEDSWHYSNIIDSLKEPFIKPATANYLVVGR